MRVCPRCHFQYPDDHETCFVDGAVLRDVQDRRIGTLVAGRYFIETILGAGAMAIVYRARRTVSNQPVAIKILSSRLARDEKLRERFRREAKNAAAVAHPNIIEIYDFGDTDDGTSFLVMELLEGVRLTNIIGGNPLPPSEVARIGLQITEGLARAHDFGVLHRDLKPDNILVCRKDVDNVLVKILDFGIARSLQDSRITSTGEIFGTPQYMAPERAQSIDTGAAADLYALGVILFEMTTGQPPFVADDLFGYFSQHRDSPPPLPSKLAPQCPVVLEELILKLLEKSPDERPVDAHKVIRVLQSLAPTSSKLEIEIPMSISVQLSTIDFTPTIQENHLGRWRNRTRVFEDMIERAYAGREPPLELTRAIAEMHEALDRIIAIEDKAREEQSMINAVEAKVWDGRRLLGHRVHELADKLSRAREQARAARREAEPALSAHEAARGELRTAFEEATRALVGNEKGALATTLRRAADVADRIGALASDATAAEHWCRSKEAEVRELEEQLHHAREDLAGLDVQLEEGIGPHERVVRECSREVEQLERSLIVMASKICAPLRPREELKDLFSALEAEGA